MKTAYYTFTTWDDSAMAAGFGGGAGGDRQGVMTRRPEGRGGVRGGEKVVDLTAWRAANLEQLQEELEDSGWESGGPVWEDEVPDEPAPPAPRSRRSRRSMLTAELISTLSVVAVAAVLIVRVLTF